MDVKKLPRRIVAVMIGTILVVVTTVGASVLWMSRTLDLQATDHALQQVENARANLLAPIRVLALEYGKWEGALPSVSAMDMVWLYENIGLSAQLGEAFQVVTIWGGPYPEPIGWVRDGPDESTSHVLATRTLNEIERALARVPLSTYRGAEFFAWSGDNLYVLGASRFETLTPTNTPLPDTERPRIALGTLIDQNLVQKLGHDYLLNGLHVALTPPSDHSYIPLQGSDGQPVAYLAWLTPHPGTALLSRMAPLLILAVLLAVVMVFLSMSFLRRGAKYLLEAEQSSSVAAKTDPLTNLPNRAALQEMILSSAPANQRAILFLDINEFKRINDTIGHAAGDDVIRTAAIRLQSLATRSCQLVRISGDEFVFVINGPDASRDVVQLANDVTKRFLDPMSIQGHQIHLRMGMGAAIQFHDKASGVDLLRQADMAMYENKKAKSSKLTIFNEMLERASTDAMLMEEGLRHALSTRSELTIAYQPIVNSNGQMVRAEALARWTSKQLGPISPDRFISVAERAGLMIPLGKRLLDIVCADLAANPGLQVSLNVSPLQLADPQYVSSLLSNLHDHNVDPARIEIELTESVVVNDAEIVASRLKELAAHLIPTALDDFGTGYSSIGYLDQLGFKTLKIDKSFVSGLSGDSKRRAIVKAMILMSHGLGMKVVCEGVETMADVDCLQDFGCDEYQGHYFDTAMTADALSRKWRCREIFAGTAA